MTQTRQLFNWFRSLLKIRHTYENALDQQRANSLSLMTWGGIIIGLFYIAFSVSSGLSSGSNAQVALYVSAVVVGLVIVLVLLNAGNLPGASLAYLLLLYWAALLAAWRYLSASASVNLLAFSMPIIAGGVLLNRRGAVAVVAAIILTVLALKVVELLGAATNLVVVPYSPGEDLLVNLTVLLVDGVILVVLTGGQRTLLQRNLALAQEMRSSATFSRTLAGVLSLDDLLARAADMIRERLGYYSVQVFLVEEKTGLLVLGAGTDIAYMAADEQRRYIRPDEPSAVSEAMRTGQAVIVSITDPAPRRAEFLSLTQAQLLIPLLSSKQAFGVLDVQRNDATTFTTAEIEALQAIAAQIAIAIQNAQLFGDLQTASRERERLAAQLAEATRRIDSLTLGRSGSSWTRYLESLGRNLIGLNWKNGVFTPDNTPSADLERALNSSMPELRVENEEQILSVPVVLRGQALGVLEFRASAKQLWNEHSLELARIIGQRLALALDNIRLYEQAQTIARREQLVNQVASRLQTTTDIDALMRDAVEAFQEALGATRASIWLGVSGPEADNGGQS
jgi:GAF domain-containing protein